MSGNNGNGIRDSKEITIEELVARIEAAKSGMSENNPNRILFEQCRVAIIYLVERIPDERLKYSRIIQP